MNRWRRHSRLLLLSALTIAVISTQVFAQSAIYRWVDAGGEVHFTQGLDSVPQAVRSRAVLIGHDKPSEPTSLPSLNPARRSAQISFTPGQPIMVTARINDGGSAKLMLDTGASRTVINPAVLKRAGRELQERRPGRAQGRHRGPRSSGCGDTRQHRGRRRAARPTAGALARHWVRPSGGDGLLGRDYLDNFTINHR
jgi:hypothetical protein